MSAQFTLDAIREAADRKYGATEIRLDEKTVVRMLNPLRLPKAARDELVATQKTLGDDGVDQADVFGKAILIVADDKGAAQLLLDTVGDDLALLAQIFTTYTEGTSAGEASASAT